MDNITVTTTVGRDDWQALLRACGQRVQERRRQLPLLVRVFPSLFWVGLVALIAVLLAADPELVDGRTLVVAASAVFVVGGFAWLFGGVQRRAYAPDENGAFIGITTFEFSPRGFTASRAHCHAQLDWAMLRDVTRTATHVFLWIDAVSAYCVRVIDLPAPMTAEEFERRLREFKAAAPEAAGATEAAVSVPADISASPGAVAESVTRPPRLRQELLALLRLKLRLPANPQHLIGRDLTIAWLALFSLLLWVGLQRIDYVGEGGRVEFMWWGLPDLARHFLWVLAVAWVLARLTSPRVPIRGALLLVLGFLPLLSVGWTFIDDLPRAWIFVAVIVLLVVAGNYFDAGVRLMTNSAQPRAVTAAIAVALGFMWFGAHYTFSSGLWHSPDDYENVAGDTAGREQLEFDQPARIEAAVGRMAAPSGDAAANYFVGFAGYGDQRVFANEIGKAASVIGARYGTGERQLLLVNDRRDREKQPYATTPALRHALVKIGKRMDVERDVLFLALSSHGDADATLSVSNEYDLWESLSGEALRAMLDESGIRWRVIVISACHSGSFIEHLKDDRTIVLTAAAKERTSFGCSDDRDLTYFGEAFYRDALPSAASLRAAFEAARIAIDAREKKETVSRSDPQAFFGPLMDAKLAELDDAASRAKPNR